jgi:hypothetical protein
MAGSGVLLMILGSVCLNYISKPLGALIAIVGVVLLRFSWGVD